MSNEPENETTTEDEQAQALVQQHLAFKMAAGAVLHTYGDSGGYCGTFDEHLVRAGLPGRPTYYADTYYPHRKPEDHVVGEATVEAFEAWKLQASKELHEAAQRFGVDDGRVAQAMSEAGFPTKHVVDVQIEGTYKFSFSTPIEVFGDEDANNSVSNSVSSRTVAARVRDELYSKSQRLQEPDFTWTATVPTTTTPPTDEPLVKEADPELERLLAEEEEIERRRSDPGSW